MIENGILTACSCAGSDVRHVPSDPIHDDPIHVVPTRASALGLCFLLPLPMPVAKFKFSRHTRISGARAVSE